MKRKQISDPSEFRVVWREGKWAVLRGHLTISTHDDPLAAFAQLREIRERRAA